jgi:hypothetical protein
VPRADARARKRHRDNPERERLHRLLEPSATLERAYRAIHAHWRSQGAAQSIVAALMFELRQGPDALKHPDNRRRLSELNDAQASAVAARVQKFMPHIAPAWTPEQVEVLISVRSQLR